VRLYYLKSYALMAALTHTADARTDKVQR
jgi:hypothetical protein